MVTDGIAILKVGPALTYGLRAYPIPMNMLHQYMPISYAKIREGKLKLDPRELAMDGIVQFMLDYESAV
mgnify:CR=1 FL=1